MTMRGAGECSLWISVAASAVWSRALAAPGEILGLHQLQPPRPQDGLLAAPGAGNLPDPQAPAGARRSAGSDWAAAAADLPGPRGVGCLERLGRLRARGA